MVRTLSRYLWVPIMLSCLLHPEFAAALNLTQAYDDALQNDPTYRAAMYDNKAGQQDKAIGLSKLLPNVSAFYTTNWNRAEIATVGVVPPQPTIYPSYEGTNFILQLRQPLFNLESLAYYYQGIAQTEYSNAQLSVSGQDLIIRLVGAYADAQLAEEQLTLAIAQRDTYAEQREMNNHKFAKGEGTVTDELETQAKYDLSEAQVLEARDNLANTRNALAAIVGQEVNQLQPLSDHFQVLPMQPESIEQWKEIALAHNAEIIAGRDALEAAHQEVNKTRAGYAPRLDLVASMNKNTSGSIYTYNENMNYNAVGIEINIPIYSGGYVSATTDQAEANHEKVQAQLDAKISEVMLELHKQYSLALSSVLRIGALERSVKSAQLLVEATKQSIKGGERTNVDLLNAQQGLYQARLDLAKARYEYLLAYLKLRKAAGTLSRSDVRFVTNFFLSGGGS